jgi:hypothetical protein
MAQHRLTWRIRWMTRIGVSNFFSCFIILVGGLRFLMILVTINVSVYDFVYLTLL